jgi:hypothetical protein
VVFAGLDIQEVVKEEKMEVDLLGLQGGPIHHHRQDDIPGPVRLIRLTKDGKPLVPNYFFYILYTVSVQVTCFLNFGIHLQLLHFL